MYEKFKNLEKEYSVEKIVHKNEQIWSFLRYSYHFETLLELRKEHIESTNQRFIKKLFLIIKNFFYGFQYWFKSYDYFIFSSSNLRIDINGKKFDKSFDKMTEILGVNKFLYIEDPVPSHFSQKNVYSKYIVSRNSISFVSSFLFKIYFLFKNNKFKIKLLDEINTNENLDVNYQKIINKFIFNKNIMKLLFKIYKPKAIFISCYYGKEYIIKAASELGIKTIEIQHGSIGRNHFAYNINKKFDISYFPDVLLSFGKYDKECIQKNNYNPFSKIYAIGNYGLEIIKNNAIPKELENLSKSYSKSISISTQYPIESDLAKFIKKIAILHPNIGFLFSLRHFPKTYYNNFNMPRNVHLFHGEFSCYDILKASSVHLSCYSTCALEALFFDKISILVNINNLAENSIEYNLNKNLYLINDLSGFKEVLESKFINEKNIFYTKGYIDNISSFKEKYLNKI
jgi:hypothetical protein